MIVCDKHKSYEEGCKLGCDECRYDHINYHMRNEDLYDLYCPLCTPVREAAKQKEAERRKREGIEKRKRTMAAKKLAQQKQLNVSNGLKPNPLHRKLHSNLNVT